MGAEKSIASARYNVSGCKDGWEGRGLPLWNKCHSNLFVLANTGEETYSLNIKVLARQFREVEGEYQVATWPKDVLVYHTATNEYRAQGQVSLGMGLNVFFWCHSRLHPRSFKTEADRISMSQPGDLEDGLNVQLVPAEGEVWDTYLLTEHARGYDSKADITPINMGKAPFFTTDRVSVARKTGKPAQLLQLTWLNAIKNRVSCMCDAYRYSCIANLPYWQVPQEAQLTTYFNIALVDHPTVYKTNRWERQVNE